MAQQRISHEVKDPPRPGYDYIVKQGDSLSTIAVQAYGCDGGPGCWGPIYDYEPNKQIIGNDPNHIQPGMRLYIPVIR